LTLVTHNGKPEPNGRDAHGRFAAGNHNGGRTPEYREFKVRAREFIEHEGFEELIRLARRAGVDQFHALRLLVEYAYGRPQLSVDITSGGAGWYELNGVVKRYDGIDIDRV
jgi:hypothetical protein